MYGSVWRREGIEKKCVHVRGKGVERLVEVVHLDDDAARDEEAEDVCRGASELVVPRQSKLDRDTEALDRHDRDGTDKRADGEIHERERASVPRDDEVDHAQREDGHDETVEQESCAENGYTDCSGRTREQGSPGCSAKCKIWSTVSMGLSGGACSTMIKEPSRHNAHPTRPRWPRRSSNRNDAKIALEEGRFRFECTKTS